MLYTVTMRYRAAGYGPWEPGQQVELTAAEAQWLNHDCPGVVEAVTPDAPAEARAPDAPESDRMVRKTSRRAR